MGGSGHDLTWYGDTKEERECDVGGEGEEGMVSEGWKGIL